MNIKNINKLIFVCGLIIGTLSISSPWEAASNDKAEDTGTGDPVSKQPASEKKTFSPKPPAIHIV